MGLRNLINEVFFSLNHPVEAMHEWESLIIPDYMDSLCGTVVDLSEVHSAALESSVSLTYPNNLDCTVTFTAPSGKRLNAQLQ